MDHLHRFRTIAWDFDGVLFNARRQSDFHHYIRLNPLKQRHFIITFRSGGLEKLMWDDLDACEARLTRQHFGGVTSVPHALWEERLPDGQHSHAYREWKGKIAASLGAEVLIDDDDWNVCLGCEKHGIEYFHPEDLFIDHMAS